MSVLKLLGRITIVSLILLVLLFQLVYAQDQGGIYVIPVEGEITPVLANFIKDSIELAHDNSAQSINCSIESTCILDVRLVNIHFLLISIYYPCFSYVFNNLYSNYCLQFFSINHTITCIFVNYLYTIGHKGLGLF